MFAVLDFAGVRISGEKGHEIDEIGKVQATPRVHVLDASAPIGSPRLALAIPFTPEVDEKHVLAPSHETARADLLRGGCRRRERQQQQG